jgi:hypothetical protein
MHGEHTREICTAVLGMTESEVDELLAAAVLEEPQPVPTDALAA